MSQGSTLANTPVRASSIIGTNLVYPGGDSLGMVKEIVIDPSTFKVAYVVVSFGGGFNRSNGKLLAMPVEMLKYDLDKGQYILDVTRERLEAAPGFQPDDWPSMADENRHRELASYHGCKPWWD
jgi:sporulation protein YlmC with PRC-barrel domain